MAIEKPVSGGVHSFIANADLSALQFTFVKLVSGGKVDAVAAATDVPIGVLQNKPTAGKTAEVMVLGITKITASASIAVGALIGTTSTGRAVAVVAGTDTTKYVLGQMLDAPGANGVLGSLFVDAVAPNRAA